MIDNSTTGKQSFPLHLPPLAMIPDVNEAATESAPGKFSDDALLEAREKGVGCEVRMAGSVKWW